MTQELADSLIDNKKKSSLMLVFLRNFWMTALIVSAIALLLKIATAFTQIHGLRDAISYVVEVIGILFMLYLLFIAEGMILVAAQIKPHDQTKIQEFLKINSDQGFHRLSNIINSMQRHYKKFIVGRQLIVIIIVVGLVFVVGSLNESPIEAPFPLLDRLKPGLGHVSFLILNNDVVLFLISTLLPCWICQLLPHWLAEGCSLQFANLPLARTLTDISLMISNLEAGWPSFVILKKLQKRGAFLKSEEISVGDEAIFKANAAYYGYSVKQRSIEILCSEVETIVEDKSICEFRSGASSDITHSVKVLSQSEIKVLGWKYGYPPDLIKGEPITNVISISLKMEASDEAIASDEISGDASEDDDEDSFLEQFLLTTVVPLRESIPRKGFAKEVVEVIVRYSLPPLITNSLFEDEFYFEIGKPTEQLTIRVQEAKNTFIQSPKVGSQPAEELPFFTTPRPLSPERAPIENLKDGWLITIHYPPIGALVFLGLNALPSS